MSQPNASNVDISNAEVVDLEEYSKQGLEVPRDRRYRIRIDRERIVVSEPSLTGRGILALVGKTPETHLLSQKLRGGQAKPVGPAEVVDFTKPGIERFMTLPNDTTDGGAPCD